MIEEIRKTAELLKSKGIKDPQVGIVLGTGLGNLVTRIEIELEIPYSECGFPEATVEFHEGKLIYGKIGGKQVLAMKGRYHFYEGYSMQQIVFPIRVMKMLGISSLLISNAAGCMNLEWKKGDLMMISDHINKFPEHPLNGPNLKELGTRFPDMSNAYDKGYRSMLRQIAIRENVTLHEGIYASAQGPMLETAAEYRYLKTIGGDAVGMSTVPEVIAAKHMGMTCFGVSVVSDLGVPGKIVEVTHEMVQEVASAAEPKMTVIMTELIESL